MTSDDQTLLDALRQTGLRLTRAIDASLDQDRTPGELATLAAAFERTGRGVRRTIAFCHHLAQPKHDPAKRTAARRRIIRKVENAIERTDRRTDTDADALRAELRAELHERLDDPEFDQDLDSLTPDQIIEQILQDFGLANTPFAPPYPRRTPAHIEIIAARAAGRAVPPTPPCPRPPEPGDPYAEPNPTVDAILAWDARKRRARPLGP